MSNDEFLALVQKWKLEPVTLDCWSMRVYNEAYNRAMDAICNFRLANQHLRPDYLLMSYELYKILVSGIRASHQAWNHRVMLIWGSHIKTEDGFIPLIKK